MRSEDQSAGRRIQEWRMDMMKLLFKRSTIVLLVLSLLLAVSGCGILDLEITDEGYPTIAETPDETANETPGGSADIEENGFYTGKEEVAEYIHVFGRLPGNYMTKNEAMDRGWDAGKGNLWEVTDRKSIGGDRFGNREGLLPDADGRKWYECDIDYEGGYRNAKRIVYSSDGLIYYTDDHYESFEKLY